MKRATRIAHAPGTSAAVILGVLSDGRERSGVDIGKFLEERGVALATSSRYFLLARLEKAGFVRARDNPLDARYRLYSITRDGEIALLDHTTLQGRVKPATP